MKVLRSINVSQKRTLDDVEREKGPFIFQITKAVNFLDFPVGEFLTDAQLQKLIQVGKVKVTITVMGLRS